MPPHLCHYLINIQSMLKFFLIIAFVAVASCGWTDDLMGFFKPSSRGAEVKEGNQGNARVVGGETASEHYPYQISMQMKKNGGGGGGLFPFINRSNKTWRFEILLILNNIFKINFFSHFCGGSVLNANHIVTAAHWY